MTRPKQDDSQDFDDAMKRSDPGITPKAKSTQPEHLTEDMVGKDHPANKPRTLYVIHVGGHEHGRGDQFGTREAAEEAMAEMRKNAGPDAHLLDWSVEERVIQPAK